MFISTATSVRIGLPDLARKFKLTKVVISGILDKAKIKPVKCIGEDKVPHYRPSVVFPILKQYKESLKNPPPVVEVPEKVRKVVVQRRTKPAPRPAKAEAPAQAVADIEVMNRVLGCLDANLHASKASTTAMQGIEDHVRQFSGEFHAIRSAVQQVKTLVRAVDKKAVENIELGKKQLINEVTSQISTFENNLGTRIEVIESVVGDLDVRTLAIQTLLTTLIARTPTPPTPAVKRVIGLVGLRADQAQQVAARLPENIRLHYLDNTDNSVKIKGLSACEVVFLNAGFSNHAAEHRIRAAGLNVELIPPGKAVSGVSAAIISYLQKTAQE